MFILYYFKTYPTFDVLAATFGLPRSKACEHAHRLAKALECTLRTQGVLPARAIDSLAQLQQVFAEVPVLLLDTTERPSTGRGPWWTGLLTTQAKKRITRTNTLLADPARYMHYLGPTTCRSSHD